MAFDAEPAPSDREPSPRGRRARLARRKRGRSSLGVESLEARVLLSTGTSIPAAEVSRLDLASEVHGTAQPDGTGPQGLRFTPPSILDPQDLNQLSSNTWVDDASKSDQVSWVLNILSGMANSPSPAPVVVPGGPYTQPERMPWSSPPAGALSSSPAGNASNTPPSEYESPSNSTSQNSDSGKLQGPMPPPPFWEVPSGSKRAVLLETLESHATRSSAQMVPGKGDTEIEGQWWPSDGMDLYRVSVQPNDEALRVDIHLPILPPGSPPVHLALFDAVGTLLGDQRLSSPSEGLSLLLNAISRKKDPQTVYLGVYCATSSAPNSQGNFGSTSTPVAYVLDVSLFNNPSSASSSDLGSSTSTDWHGVMTPVAPLQTGTGLGTSDSTDAGGSLTTTPTSLTLTQSIVPQQTGSTAQPIRPSAWRTVAPLGGVLSPRTTRGVDRRAGAYVDFSLLPALEEEVATGEPSDAEIQTAEPVVEPLPTGGRLPILGASLPAFRNLEVQDDLQDAQEPPETSSATVLDARADQVRRTEAQQASEVENLSVISDSTPTDRPPADRPRSLGLLRTGVGLAYALAFTCLLPDLSAMFQASGGRKRRPLHWGFSRRWLRRR